MEPGTIVGSYEIVGEIGRGGMATVYRAYQRSLDRFVALKVLHIADEASAETRGQFLEHARLVARLHHPNVVQVYDLVEQDGQLYLSTELVEGDSLLGHIGAPMPPQRATAIVAQIAAALDAAHARGIVHGGVTPSNILLDGKGRVLLDNFALSGQQTGAAGDVYALGIVAFELLTGSKPSKDDSDPSPSSVGALNSSLPAVVDAVLARALAEAPVERYATALQFANALRSAFATDSEATPGARPATTSAPSPESNRVESPAEARKPWLKSRAALPLGVVLAVLVLVGTFWAAGRTTNANTGGGPQDAPVVATRVLAPAGVQASSPVTATPPSAGTVQTAVVKVEATGTPATPSAVAAQGTATPAEPEIFMAVSRDGVNFSGDQQLAGPRGFFVAAFSRQGGGVDVYATGTRSPRLRAWSTTDFRRWTEQPLEAGMTTLFADIVKLADGSYRMYYIPAAPVAQLREGREVHSAISADGVVFRDEPGVRLAVNGLVYPSVAVLAGRWVLTGQQLEQQGGVVSVDASSTDGLNFALHQNAVLPAGALKVATYDGSLHLFVEVPAFTSWTSTDGKRWTLDPGVRLHIDGQGKVLQWGIVKTDDGVYRLLYSLGPATSVAPAPVPNTR